MGCAQHALLLQPTAVEEAVAASAIKSLCLSVHSPLPPSCTPLTFCTHPVRQHPFARMRASVRHAKFPCNQQLLLLFPLCLPLPLSRVFQANYTITTTRQAYFLEGAVAAEGGRGERGACSTSKCHEKCMSCCRRCCCSKCRQRLIISNWVNGSNSISSSSGRRGVAQCVR